MLIKEILERIGRLEGGEGGLETFLGIHKPLGNEPLELFKRIGGIAQRGPIPGRHFEYSGLFVDEDVRQGVAGLPAVLDRAQYLEGGAGGVGLPARHLRPIRRQRRAKARPQDADNDIE